MVEAVATIDIPVRLEEPGRVFFFETADFLILTLPFVLGMIVKAFFSGAIFSIVLYMIWTHLKGRAGYYGLHAARYWFLPGWATGAKALPSSAVIRWAA